MIKKTFDDQTKNFLRDIHKKISNDSNNVNQNLCVGHHNH